MIHSTQSLLADVPLLKTLRFLPEYSFIDRIVTSVLMTVLSSTCRECFGGKADKFRIVGFTFHPEGKIESCLYVSAYCPLYVRLFACETISVRLFDCETISDSATSMEFFEKRTNNFTTVRFALDSGEEK